MRPHALLPLALALACGDSGTDSAATALTTTSTDVTATTSAADTTGGDLPTSDATTSDPTSTSTSTTADDTTTSTSPTDDTTTTTADDTTTAPVDDTTTTAADDTTTTAPPPVCGDGVLDPGEACDDGVTQDCENTHDGGDGTCVPAGQCLPDYVLSGDTCVQAVVTAHVHVMVSNTCDMQVDPLEFSVEPGQKLRLEYHNHSVDYPIDVWMHYNGGYTDLEPGGTWKEIYEHCSGPNPSEGWAEISTACSQYVLPIHCL